MESTIVTFSDLSQYGEVAIVKDAATGKCWTITQQVDWVPEAVALEIEKDYPDCDACLGNRLYALPQSCSMEECGDGGEGGSDQIVTKEDLHVAVGMYVKVGGKCYLVTEGGGEVTDETLSYQGPFASCDDCLEAAVGELQEVGAAVLAGEDGDVAETATGAGPDGPGAVGEGRCRAWPRPTGESRDRPCGGGYARRSSRLARRSSRASPRRPR